MCTLVFKIDYKPYINETKNPSLWLQYVLRLDYLPELKIDPVLIKPQGSRLKLR